MISNSLLAAEGENNYYIWVFVALLVVLVVVLLVVPMFTNKKRAKETSELHNSLKPGDVIKTVGGIIGTIIEIRQISPVDKEMVIETGVGDNKTTMVLDIQALYVVMSRVDAPVEETPAENEPEGESTEAIGSPVDDEAETVSNTESVAAVDPVDAELDENVEAVPEKPVESVTEENVESEAKVAKKSGAKKSTKK